MLYCTVCQLFHGQFSSVRNSEKRKLTCRWDSSSKISSFRKEKERGGKSKVSLLNYSDNDDDNEDQDDGRARRDNKGREREKYEFKTNFWCSKRERERRKESRELFCRCVTHLVELSSTSSQVLERGERRKIFHIHDSLKKNLEIEAKISLQQGVL